MNSSSNIYKMIRISTTVNIIRSLFSIYILSVVVCKIVLFDTRHFIFPFELWNFVYNINEALNLIMSDIKGIIYTIRSEIIDIQSHFSMLEEKNREIDSLKMEMESLRAELKDHQYKESSLKAENDILKNYTRMHTLSSLVSWAPIAIQLVGVIASNYYGFGSGDRSVLNSLVAMISSKMEQAKPEDITPERLNVFDKEITRNAIAPDPNRYSKK